MPQDDKEEKVQTGGWDDNVKIRSRTFNGPAAAHDPLRIAMSKEAYADLLGHAKESLDREICGVLLGDLCEDEYGRFIDIQVALRGGAAKSKGTSVTFTQETWNEIHAAKEDRHPKLQIVGWYHSHPGFGVEFSDMDRFIQQNFFGGPGQIAFVTDPLGGQEAIDANVDGAITHVERFWVDGRERRCYVPAGPTPAAGSAAAATATAGSVPTDLSKRLDDLQDRIRQLTDTVEKQRNWFYNLMTFLGMIVAGLAIVALVWYLFWEYRHPFMPPQEMTNGSIPMVVDGKPTLVSVSIKKWEMPPQFADQIAMDFYNLVDQQKKAQEAAAKAATQPATATASAPATKP